MNSHPGNKRRFLILSLLVSLLANVWLGIVIHSISAGAMRESVPLQSAKRPDGPRGPVRIENPGENPQTPDEHRSQTLRQGWVRVGASAWSRHCSLSEAGMALASAVSDYLGITPSQQKALNKLASDCVSDIKEIEIHSVEVRTDDSGSYYYLPAFGPQIESLLSRLQTDIRSIFHPTTAELILNLFRADAWLQDACVERKIGYSIDSENELYFEYGRLAHRIPNEARLGAAPVGLPDTLIERISHILDVHKDIPGFTPKNP